MMVMGVEGRQISAESLQVGESNRIAKIRQIGRNILRRYGRRTILIEECY